MKESCQRWTAITALATMLLGQGSPPLAFAVQEDTATPIKHVIVLIGENRTFDHVFGTYKPKHQETVLTLVSEGIVRPDGSPGLNFGVTQQFQVNTPLPASYFLNIGLGAKTPYAPFLPTPELGGAPNSLVSLAQLIANPTGVQPPFDKTISRPQLAL